MGLKLDRDVRRITVIKAGASSDGGHTVYRNRDDDDDDDGSTIKRVTVLKRDDRGNLVSRESYDGERRGKRSTRRLRPIERGIRNLVQFQSRVLDNYMDRHKRSSEKKRDGWLKDMPRNLVKAVKKSKPKRLLRLTRVYRD